MVTAKRVKAWDDDLTGSDVTSWIHAVYEYEVDGVRYTYRYMQRAAAPYTLKLYYTKNPARAFMEKRQRSTIVALLFYLLPFVVAGVVVNLLKGI